MVTDEIQNTAWRAFKLHDGGGGNTSGEYAQLRAALEAVVPMILEEAAKVAEEPELECCNKPLMREIMGYDERGEPSGQIGEEVDGCCGNPDQRPKTIKEITAAIRALGRK
jgi:hypothetical protein